MDIKSLFFFKRRFLWIVFNSLCNSWNPRVYVILGITIYQTIFLLWVMLINPLQIVCHPEMTSPVLDLTLKIGMVDVHGIIVVFQIKFWHERGPYLKRFETFYDTGILFVNFKRCNELKYFFVCNIAAIFAYTTLIKLLMREMYIKYSDNYINFRAVVILVKLVCPV